MRIPEEKKTLLEKVINKKLPKSEEGNGHPDLTRPVSSI
jgi:hypothetical protein